MHVIGLRPETLQGIKVLLSIALFENYFSLTCDGVGEVRCLCLYFFFCDGVGFSEVQNALFYVAIRFLHITWALFSKFFCNICNWIFAIRFCSLLLCSNCSVFLSFGFGSLSIAEAEYMHICMLKMNVCMLI